MKRNNVVLMFICIFLICLSLVIGSKIGEFGGADDQIAGRITELNKDYKPWFENIWIPPSKEIESMLFSLQAAIGAGYIGYYIGKKRNVQNNNSIFKS